MQTRRLAAALLSVLVAVTLIALAVPAFDQGYANGCDNEAGECVRPRQRYVTIILGIACLTAGFASLLNALAFARQPEIRSWRYVGLGLAAGFAGVVLAVDPVSHLGHDTEWLSGWPWGRYLHRS